MTKHIVDTDLGSVLTDLDYGRVRRALEGAFSAVSSRLAESLVRDPDTGADTLPDLVERFIRTYEGQDRG